MTTQNSDTGLPPSEGSPVEVDGRRRLVLIALAVALLLLAAGISFGIIALERGSRVPASASAAIPSPAAGPGAFVEDDDLTAQDNQSNLLTSTAPGLVHILSGATPTGTGLVLTPSGKVLTSVAAVRGAAKLRVEYVASGAVFSARVIGTDPASGFALIQMAGPAGRAFAVAQMGNSATIVNGVYASKQFSYHLQGEVIDTAVGTGGTGDNMALDVGTLVNLDATTTVGGRSRTGLLESVLQSAPSTGIGGPLVDLDGQVIGITVAASGSGMHIDGYAIPINSVLAAAAKIDAAAHDLGGERRATPAKRDPRSPFS
jgi:S1-C subfamily serine protease